MKGFMLGCNYWASHAGIEMWKEWDEAQVEQDLSTLSQYGMDTLRVFPLWRDFQPIMPVISPLRTEYMLEGCREPENPWFLDEVMMDRFARFCDLAGRYGFRLIVGLITGWMSGRLFVPSALYNKEICTDPVSLMFQQKFIRGFVSRFAQRQEICAWDLGNECNVMATGKNFSREHAYHWTSMVANAIKAVDPTRPVISGMHGLGVAKGAWLIEDQGECTDLLTTHPYAFFVPHCAKDAMDSFRTLMHATCESLLYSDVGGKPCLVEELGTLGPGMCSDEVGGSFMRLNLLSNWVHGAAGVLWWCAHEQNHLTEPPHSRSMLERELGMLRDDMTPKPVISEMKKFALWMDQTDLTLPPHKTDGVILFTREQDHWGVGYMSFCLGKQAGATLSFAAPDRPIPESDVYFMPSVVGDGALCKQRYEELKARVCAGATLYVSVDDAFFTEREEFFGVSVVTRELSAGKGVFSLDGKEIPYEYGCRTLLNPHSSRVLARDEEGNPLLTLHFYGKGKVYYLNYPLEKMLCGMSRAFDGDAYGVYQRVLCEITEKKSVRKHNPKVGITEHGRFVALINYSNQPVDPMLELDGVEIHQIYRGDPHRIDPCDACIFSVK